MADYRKQLQDLLYELFQFDSADLDFGFYAVMNQKREQIKAFIEADLLEAIDEGLKDVAEQSQMEAQDAFKKAKKKIQQVLGEGALDGDELNERHTDLPIGKEYLAAKAALEAAVVAEDLEAQIYNDLYAFFARYYQDGDFISQRRYGRTDKYAIPYNGQEVHLHWANFDQYYVKTGAHFQNYSFTVPGGAGLEEGATIRVHLNKVDIPRDNIRGEKRFFIYAAEQNVIWDEEQQTLFVPMEYRPLTEEESARVGTRNQQDKLLDEAYKAILKSIDNTTLIARLTEVDPQKQSDKDRLTYHLYRYAAENTRDFFVHKDLEGFFRREFDYYLKAEVLRLEDVNFNDPIHAHRASARLKTMRSIGEKIIVFLNQLESLQRKLFLKKKFILQSDYCLTLDKIPADRREEFFPEILTNDRQMDQWRSGYRSANWSKLNLGRNLNFVLDTANFGADFKVRLLSCFDNLDDQIDGILVKGENFQALNLLAERFQQKVSCIYIDPPFNLGENKDFIYKTNYLNSSWLTLLQDRIELSRSFLEESAGFFLRCDYHGNYLARALLDSLFGSANFKNELVVNRFKRQLKDLKQFNYATESLFLYSNSDQFRFFEQIKARSCSFCKRPLDPNWVRMHSPGLRRPPERTVLGKVLLPPKGRHWTFKQETLDEYEQSGRIRINTEESYVDLEGNRIEGLPEYLQSEDTPVDDNWTDIKGYAFGSSFSTENAEELLQRVVATLTKPGEYVMDFFMGSGTTQAVAHKMGRKWIGVEMDNYFDEFPFQRMVSVLSGNQSGISKEVQHRPGGMFQYITIESYDDTFHNIRFRDIEEPQLRLLHDMPDYFLSYILDHEAEGSPTLLDLEQFDAPFDYKLQVTNQDGVLVPQSVDLVTTFNFLLGLAINNICQFKYNGNHYIRVIGTNPAGMKVCVVWRNVVATEELDAERKWLEQEVLKDVQYDKLYINGENTVPNALLIEEEFKRRMFEGVL